MKVTEIGGLSHKITQKLCNSRNSSKRGPRNYFHASELPPVNEEFCRRKLYFGLSQPEKASAETSTTLMNFRLGDAIHEFVQDDFKNHVKEISVEESINTTKPIEIHGRVDYVAEVDGEVHVIEIKSISGNFFRKLGNENRPLASHYSQLQYYLHGKECENGYLFYVNKENGELLDFKIERDREHMDKVYGLLGEVLTSIDDKKIPTRMFADSDRFPCGYCKFREHCNEV